MLREELGPTIPFATYFAAVTVAALAGMGPALLATALSALAGVYLFMAPYDSFRLRSEEAWAAGIFTLVCLAIGALSLALQRARRRAEQTDEHARQLSAIVESSSDPVVGKSLDLRILSWNRAAEEKYGFSAAEAIGRHVSLFVPQDRVGELEEAIRRIARGDTVAPFETVRRRKDGGAVEISLAVSPIRNDRGQVIAVSGIDRDLSARKREERRLALLAQISDVFTHSGLDFKKAAGEIVQRTAEVIGDLCVLRLASADRMWLEPAGFHHTSPEAMAWLAEIAVREPAAGDALLSRVLARNEAVLVPQVDSELLQSLARRDAYTGPYAPHSVLLVPMRLGSTPVGVLSVARNTPGPPYTAEDQALLQAIADRAAATLENARLYEQVSVANRLKDDFLSTLSHELRTPLNAILGWSTLLQGGNLSPEDSSRAIGAILRNTEAQNRLIAEILDMSRMASGKLRIQAESVDPAAVIEAAVETVIPAAKAKDVRLRTILDPGAGPVSGDAQRLQQVVWNLLSNSIKFTPRGGQVEVRLERVESHVEIAVQDTGIGIAPEFLPHVFELFRQADSSPSRQYGGLGLGLALAKHLVELHGGTIEAASPGTGGGTRMLVKLPLRVRHPAERARMAAPAEQPEEVAIAADGELRGVKVLVIDDDPEALSLLRTVLERSGATVIVASSAARGLVELSSRNPDVLLSDIGMPGEDGYALIRQVRALPADLGGRVPAAAITAYARAEDRLTALQAGYQVHIAKPLVPAEVVAAVRSLAGRY